MREDRSRGQERREGWRVGGKQKKEEESEEGEGREEGGE